ncbi:winged helix DNA-binding domain-containing protein [Vararia minispora EC-137]|uniref:Winged helix DNA-binding domain-containing protein n=1 Tax=Vararia minispora EC-137 TaxID=1314806 RepID=A0ACB8R011_9AGAM|nr:winged helix DNA-binding domain-containing protein [Vararia minispora EC-137]
MHRRGGAGLAGLERLQQSQRSFATLSSQLSRAQIDNLHAELAHFRAALTHFATNHRADIRRDPTFRRAFTQMCAQLGVDPLAGPRKGGWWEDALGLGDWQAELAVQIVDVCVSTRERNGGLIDMTDLVRLVSRMRGVDGGAITEDDVVRSLKALRPLGAGYEVVDFGDGRKMVRSVAKELDADQMAVLAISQAHGGRVDAQMLVEQRGWTPERARAVLNIMLLKDGTCWLDDQDGPNGDGVAYWVPATMQWGE